MAVLADLAARRPLALLGVAIAVVAVLVAVAIGAPDRLGAGSTRLDGAGSGRGDLVVVARGPFPASSPVYRVAIATILSGLRAEPAVASARLGGSSGDLSSLDVTLDAADEAERERDVERIADEIDPGPLTLTYGAESRVLLDARHSLAGQLWKLELLALPFVALILAWILGPGAAIGAAIAAVGAAAGALVGLRVASAFAGVSLLGIAPAAVVGLTIAIEVAALLRGLHRRQRPISAPTEALRRALGDGAPLGLALALVAGLVPLALLVTPFPATGSIIIATAVAVIIALALAAVVVPPLLVLEARVFPAGEAGGGTERGGAPGAVLGRLATSRIALAVVAVVGVAAPLAIAAPARDVQTRPLAAADLPRGSQALVAAREEAKLGPAQGGPSVAPASATGELVGKLPLAAAIVAAGLAVVLLALGRSPRALAAVPVALLPAAAALGAAAFVFAQGHLTATFGFAAQGSLDTGAAVCAVAALVAIGAGRSVRDWLAVRAERRRGGGAAGTAELAADLVMPAVAAASLVGAAACGVLAGADLYPAREFGLMVGAGLVLDLILRPPLIAVLARWAPSG